GIAIGIIANRIIISPTLLYSNVGHHGDYLHSILKTHTVHTCEGSTLSIRCPSRTSVSVLSAFYGRRTRRAPRQSKNQNQILLSLQKVLSECQDRRSCHIPVFNPVFGPDPCPMTSKYLLVSYKCRPGRTELIRLNL
uniref:Si:ch73-335m24.2 n=1 Tax=Cynoglossus semilaevis TaxID=244447 RepID=A0A3P8UJA7_CYNSE